MKKRREVPHTPPTDPVFPRPITSYKKALDQGRGKKRKKTSLFPAKKEQNGPRKTKKKKKKNGPPTNGVLWSANR